MKLYPLALTALLACSSPTVEERINKVVDDVGKPLAGGIPVHEYQTLVFSSMKKQHLVEGERYVFRTQEMDSMFGILEQRLLATKYKGLHDVYMGVSRPLLDAQVKEDVDGYENLLLRLSFIIPDPCSPSVYLQKVRDTVDALDLKTGQKWSLVERIVHETADIYGVKAEVLSALRNKALERAIHDQ